LKNLDVLFTKVLKTFHRRYGEDSTVLLRRGSQAIGYPGTIFKTLILQFMKPLKNPDLFTVLALLLILSLPFADLAYGKNTSEPREANSSEEAARMFEQGRECLEMGRTQDAALFFEKAVEKNAQLAVAWLYKALTAETDADRKTSMEKAIFHRNNAGEEEKLLIDIELTYADNNSEKRFMLAKQLVELCPADARALLILAGEYQHQGNTTKFRDLAYEAVKAEPSSPLGYRALAASWVLNEPIDFMMAEKYMKKFVELRPNEVSAHIALGDIHRAFLSMGNAVEAYSKAVELEPGNVVALSKRGYVHTYSGSYEQARADFKKASELKSPLQHYSQPYTGIYSYLFYASQRVPYNENAVAGNTFNTVKKMPLNVNSDNCYFCRTFISMCHGLIVSPEQSLSACLSIQKELYMESKVPDENTIEANIAFVEGMRAILNEDYDNAKKVIKEYATLITPEMKSRNNEAHNFLTGIIHYKQGNYHKSLVSFKNSDTSNIFVKYNMGLAYDKIGKFQQAKKMFTEVSECNFANASSTYMFAFSKKWLKLYDESSLAQK
jgi:tetratricopeptide (TPR) repeat protein